MSKTRTGEYASAVFYYDRASRSWWAYAVDSNGDQIGEATFSHNRDGVRNTLCTSMLDRVAYMSRDNDEWTHATSWCRRAMQRGIVWNR